MGLFIWTSNEKLDGEKGRSGKDGMMMMSKEK
jgi:hypothetical protein